MYNFNSIEKVINNIKKLKNTHPTPPPSSSLIITHPTSSNLIFNNCNNNSNIKSSPYCMGASCHMMITSTSSIPIMKNNLNGSILPFLKEECPHYLSSHRNNNNITRFTPTNKNNTSSNNLVFNFIPANRLYTTSINNNKFTSPPSPNTNTNTTTNSDTTSEKSKKTTRQYRNPDNPFLKKNESIPIGNKNNHGTPPLILNACSVNGKCLISQTSEGYQNCVKFETNKSDYVHEIIEGILPKELISGSRMITPNEPHCIFVNFSSAVKAYQADLYIRQWSEKNLPSLKSILLKQSLDPIYSIKQSTIEKVIDKSSFINNNDENDILIDLDNINLPEYPIPNYYLISNENDCNELVKSKLLNGKSIGSIKDHTDEIILSFDLDYYHTKDEMYHFYVLSISNDKNTLILNLDLLNGLPNIISNIFNSKFIKKIGFSHHKYQISDFEKQFNLNIKNYDDLSKNQIILHSKPKTLTSMVAILLKKKLPRLEINRFIDNNENGLFSEKKLQHYAQISNSVYLLNNHIHEYSYCKPFYL